MINWGLKIGIYMFRLILATAVFYSVGCSVAKTPAIDELSEKTRTLVHYCQSCHSNKEMQRGPLLEGLELWYMEKSVLDFKKGIRGGNPEDKSGQLMYSAVKDLSQEDLIEAVRWFAGQPRPKIKAYIKGDTITGQKLYKDNCFGCHEHTMGKFFSESPDLYKLEDWYVLSQLRGFKSKVRGSHPEDERGLSMQTGVQHLTSEDFKAIIAFLATFQERP